MVTSHQAAAVGAERGRAWSAGRRYQVADLFKALLLISANDAAVALAQATGSYAKGVAMMNAEAHHLQAYDTVAKQPNGLPAKGQHTSAYDQALFARQALTMPAFMQIRRDAGRHVPAARRSTRSRCVNQNTDADAATAATSAARSAGPAASEATYIGMARRRRRHADRDRPALHAADRDHLRGQSC